VDINEILGNSRGDLHGEIHGGSLGLAMAVSVLYACGKPMASPGDIAIGISVVIDSPECRLSI
jgi:hypothetical protein